MKKLLTFLLVNLSLLSCSTSKDCTCSTEYIVVQDTLVLPRIHDHISDGEINYCLYIEEFSYEMEDTIWVECFGCANN